MIKAVLFDFDGVLGNTMEDNFLAWQQALRNEGIAIDREEYFLLEGMPLKEIAKTLYKHADRECADPETIVQRKEKYYREHASFSFYPGAELLLTKLAAQGMPFALVTAARRSRLESSVPKNFLDRFSAIITGEQSDRGKPFPDPYLAAAEALSIPPQECIVVENAPLGIRAAKAAGCRCIAISSTLSEDKLSEADETVKTINNLKLI